MNTTISFSHSQFKKATSWRDLEYEDTSYMLGYRSRGPDGDRLLVREVMVPGSHEVTRSRFTVEASPAFLCGFYDRARSIGATEIIQNHDHYFSRTPKFSNMDDVAGLAMAEDIDRLGINARVSQIVFGRDNTRFSARLVVSNGRHRSFSPISKLELVSSQGWTSLIDGRVDGTSEDKEVRTPIFEKRNIEALGNKAIHALHKIKVLMVGGGGLGSAIAYMLTRLGVRHLTTLDYQRIDGSNCNRLYFIDDPRKAIGRKKASFFARAMRRFNPCGDYRAFNGNVFDYNCGPVAIKNADVVICTLDSHSGRAETSSLCARYGKPLLNVANAIYPGPVSGVAAAYTAIQWFIPRDPEYPCLSCQGVINPDIVNHELMSDRYKAMREKAGYVVGTPESPAPQVVPINSVAAGLAAWELVMWLGAVRKPTPFVQYDVMSHHGLILKPRQDPACTICGMTPSSCLVTGDTDLVMMSTTRDSDQAASLVGCTETFQPVSSVDENIREKKEVTP